MNYHTLSLSYVPQPGASLSHFNLLFFSLHSFLFLCSYLQFVSRKIKWGSNGDRAAWELGKKCHSEIQLVLKSIFLTPTHGHRVSHRQAPICDVSVPDVWGKGQSEVHSFLTSGPSLGKIPSDHRCLFLKHTQITHTHKVQKPEWRNTILQF